MAGNLFNFPRAIAFDVGVVQPGAKITFTATGTTNLQNTYTDIALTVASTNPVIANSEGLFAKIYLDPTLPDYRVKYTDSSDVLIYQVDDVPASQAGQSLTLNDTAPFIDLIESDAAVNNTSWRIQVNSEQFKIQVANDALAAFTDILTVDRTANTVDAIALKGTSLSNIGTLSTGAITSSGSVFITEAAAAIADVAGDGQFWIENTVPNEARFTDDSGVDFSLNHTVLKYKTSTTTHTVDIIPGNDPDLTYAISATGTYAFELFFTFWGTTTGTQGLNFNINYSGTVGVGSRWHSMGRINGVSAIGQDSPVSSTTSAIGSTSSDITTTDFTDHLSVFGTLVADTTGTIAFASSQQASEANVTNIGIGSWLRITKLS